MARRADVVPIKIPLDGRWVSNLDPSLIGRNFRTMKNLAYEDGHPQAVRGMTKINTTAITTYTNIKSGFHFRKDSPSESHIIVQGWNASLDASALFALTAVPPTAGNFGSAILTEPSGSDIGYFSNAPAGYIAYCNSKGAYLWTGTEARIGGFINYDPDATFSYNFTEVMVEKSTATGHLATLTRVSDAIDSNVKLLMHFENSSLDSSPSGHTVLNSGVTYSTLYKKWGSYAASFDGAADHYEIPDHADFDFSGGTFNIDVQIRVGSLAAARPIYYHYTDASNYIKLWVSTGGVLSLQIVEAGATLDLVSPSGAITTNTWTHIEVDENGNYYYMFVNGVLQATTSSAVRCVDYSSSPYIGTDLSTYFLGQMDELRVSDTYRHTTTFTPPSDAYGAGSYKTYVYVGTVIPAKAFKAYVQTANTGGGSLAELAYWDGDSWDPCTSVTDGTSALAQTGTITFDDTVSVAKIKMLDGVPLYWYRFTWLNIDDAVQLYWMTYSASMQTLKDNWDGINRQIGAFLVYDNSTYNDNTGNVFAESYDSTDSATYADLSSLATATDFVVAGFPYPIMGVEFTMVGGAVNTTANTLVTVYYWNGKAWTSVGAVDDGTSEGGISLAKSGVISWQPVTYGSEFKKTISKDLPMYYYKLVFSQNLSGTVKTYFVSGIPSPVQILAYKFPFMAQSRLWLANQIDGYQNEVYCSDFDSAVVFNGDNSFKMYIGNDKGLTCGSGLYVLLGSDFYDVILLLKEDECFLLVGNSPEDWLPYPLSRSVGCAAPNTLRVTTVGIPEVPNARKEIAMWQGADGIYLFEGRGPINVSKDIEDWFDVNKSYSINRSKITESVGFFDSGRTRYHWLFASGTSTTLNKEFVYDLRRHRWFEIDRGTGKYLQFGLETRDSYGSPYPYGAIAGGYIERLEYGTSFDDNPITCELETGDIIISGKEDFYEEVLERYLELVHVSKNNTSNKISVKLKIDGNASYDESFTFAASGSKRIAKKVHSFQTDPGTFFSVYLSLSTSNEDLGFEPLYLAMYHKWVRLFTSEGS